MAAVVTATTAQALIADKTATCIPGLLDAIIKEITVGYGITPQQAQTMTLLRAELVTNISDFTTALTP